MDKTYLIEIWLQNKVIQIVNCFSPQHLPSSCVLQIKNYKILGNSSRLQIPDKKTPQINFLW